MSIAVLYGKEVYCLRKNKNLKLSFIISFCVILCIIMGARRNVLKENNLQAAGKFKYEYGVFVGLSAKKMNRMKEYHTVIIDAQYYTKKEIAKLRKRGHIVYSYINIGSIEKWRPYYKKYKNICLGRYENWEDEYWIDVSKKKWIDNMDSLSKKLAAKKVDGFFVDNVDVYYQYPKKKIFDGITRIIKNMGKKVIVNGGDTYIKKYIKTGRKISKIVDGVNQETVYTTIDFANKSYAKAKKSDRRYYEKYLDDCKKQGIKVYITEYTKSQKIEKEVKLYAEKKGYICYVAHGIELNC